MKQTLLLGNGLNLLIDKDKWEWKKLLSSSLKDNCKLVGTDKNTIPYTHLYEDIYLNAKVANITHELDVKKGIADKLMNLPDSQNKNFIEIMQKLLSIDFNDILTTNYDYSVESYFKDNGFEQIGNDPKERIYSIRRNDLFKNGNVEKRIWHIHGEARFPESIMLGYDHYCGSIAKISEYLKSGKSANKKVGNLPKKIMASDKTHYILKEIEYCKVDPAFGYNSWLDSMFLSDVHILGLGLGFSEIDLWWVLNKRCRYINETLGQAPNNIYYYGYASSEIKDMLAVYGVNVENVINQKLSNNEWFFLYEDMISVIEENIDKRTK